MSRKTDGENVEAQRDGPRSHLRRPDIDQPNDVELICLKNRYGPLDSKKKLWLDRKTVTFETRW